MRALELYRFLGAMNDKALENTDITIQIENELFPVFSVCVSEGSDTVDDDTIIIEVKCN